jgi:hypothetical protein
MPRVHHVKRAQKPNRVVTQEDIDRAKSGEDPEAASYYWWAFRYGGKRMSKKRPRQSQLTQSKWSQVYEAQEQISDSGDVSDLKDAIENAISVLEEVGGEYEEAAEQFGGGGDNQERADFAEELKSELDEYLDKCQEEVDCPDCDGGRQECSECHGSGNTECAHCDGSGDSTDEEDEPDDCTECDGGTIDCESCEGDGDLECGSCGGSGTFELHEAPQETQEEKFEEIKSEVEGLDWDLPC